MKITPQFLNIEGLGRDIAHMSDNEQSAILNGIASEWEVSMSNKSDAEMQLCYVSCKLHKRTQEWIIALADFCKIRLEQAGEAKP